MHRMRDPERIRFPFVNHEDVILRDNVTPEELKRAAFYCMIVLHSIVKRHISSLLGLTNDELADLDYEIGRWFDKGVFNDVRVLKDWFHEKLIA